LTPQEAEHVRIGQFWSKTAQEHDPEKLGSVLSDDFIMWYNFEKIDRTKEEFLETLRNAHKAFNDQVHTDERILPTPEGFVLQATMNGTFNGQKIAAAFCLIATIKDGKVVRGDEYFDTGQLVSQPVYGSTEMTKVEAN
jgi:ketosteroid isomerase-like protein